MLSNFLGCAFFFESTPAATATDASDVTGTVAPDGDDGAWTSEKIGLALLDALISSAFAYVIALPVECVVLLFFRIDAHTSVLF